MTLGVRKKVCVAKRRKVQKEPLEELEAFLDPSIENDPEYQQLTSDVQRVQYQKFVEHSHKLFTDEYESQLTAAIFFRSILASNRYDPLDSVLEKGIASRIIFLLKTSHDMRLRNELLWSITNIACGEPHQTKILFDEGCVDLLVDIIAESPQRHAEQAIWAMGNVGFIPVGQLESESESEPSSPFSSSDGSSASSFSGWSSHTKESRVAMSMVSAFLLLISSLSYFCTQTLPSESHAWTFSSTPSSSIIIWLLNSV